MSVIDFATAKAEREPHSEGLRVCLGCRHEWRGVSPIGVSADLECPECGMPKGVTKHLYSASEGDAILLCDCGCEALFAYKRAANFYVRCMACGTDLTESFYEG